MPSANAVDRAALHAKHVRPSAWTDGALRIDVQRVRHRPEHAMIECWLAVEVDGKPVDIDPHFQFVNPPTKHPLGVSGAFRAIVTAAVRHSVG